MRPNRPSGNIALAALVVAIIALVASATGLAGATGTAVFGTSAKSRPLRLRCPTGTVDLGSWCLATNLYVIPTNDTGQNDYFYATHACGRQGGYLPSAAQLIGAAGRVKLDSVLSDSGKSATIDVDPTDGLKDLREMSSTLVTTAAGSSAAGSEGVSEAATGDPRSGEPNPTPQPANPDPETLQYVTVYDNHGRGGFAGSAPVSTPENFRCAFNKTVIRSVR